MGSPSSALTDLDVALVLLHLAAAAVATSSTGLMWMLSFEDWHYRRHRGYPPGWLARTVAITQTLVLVPSYWLIFVDIRRLVLDEPLPNDLFVINQIVVIVLAFAPLYLGARIALARYTGRGVEEEQSKEEPDQ